MSLKIFLRRIMILLKAKYSFDKIKETEIVIYDKNGSEIFSELLYDKKYFILHTRFEKINIKIFLKSLLKYGFKWKPINYSELFLQYLKPKYVVTFIDNDQNFWKLKNKFNNIQTCFIQNGYRDNFNDFFDTNKNFSKTLKVDKMFVFNNSIALEFKKYIQGETIVIGSFFNNKYKRFKKIDKDILYISSWDDEYSNYNNYEEYLLFHKVDKLAFELISKFAEKYEFKLKVLGRKIKSYNEEQFYKNLNKNFIFLKRNTDRKYSYRAVDESKLIVGIDSTLAYESLSRGNKTFLISCRNDFIDGESFQFGWPKKYGNHGVFWSNTFNEKIIFKSLENLIKLNKTNFNEELQFFKNEFIYYDEGNAIVKNFFKNNFK